MSSSDTIFALSTPPGRSGVAVIRISGDKAIEIARILGAKLQTPRRADLVKLRDPKSGEILDQAIAVYFKAPHSFTGEDIVELHTHGGRAVVQAVLNALSGNCGARPAMAGEFTRRAFDNEKLDLTEIEGLADLIDAETEHQRRQALRQMSGHLGALYQGWSQRLLHALAHIEAYLDFPDEEIPGDIFAKLRSDVEIIGGELRAHLSDSARGEKLRTGMTMAILGPPNAGKSSLLNVLARRDAAIVSHTAGTTRDVIEVHLELSGYPVTLADTAGIRDTSDDIEREGVRRSLNAAQMSDLRLIVLDSTQDLTAIDPQIISMMQQKGSVIVWNKSDLNQNPPRIDSPSIQISTKTGYNLPQLLELLGQKAASEMAVGETPAITRIRHRQAVQHALDAVTRFVVASGADLMAEDLRTATHALARITGKVDVEDILDIIFMDFCIGK